MVCFLFFFSLELTNNLFAASFKFNIFALSKTKAINHFSGKTSSESCIRPIFVKLVNSRFLCNYQKENDLFVFETVSVLMWMYNRNCVDNVTMERQFITFILPIFLFGIDRYLITVQMVSAFLWQCHRLNWCTIIIGGHTKRLFWLLKTANNFLYFNIKLIISLCVYGTRKCPFASEWQFSFSEIPPLSD